MWTKIQESQKPDHLVCDHRSVFQARAWFVYTQNKVTQLIEQKFEYPDGVVASEPGVGGDLAVHGEAVGDERSSMRIGGLRVGMFVNLASE